VYAEHSEYESQVGEVLTSSTRWSQKKPQLLLGFFFVLELPGEGFELYIKTSLFYNMNNHSYYE